MTKQYAPRDIRALDRNGNHYCRHMSAMTGEELHSKSDIAAELAWRDHQIDKLREALAYSADYLNSNKLNSIGYGSKAHREMIDALDETA